MKHEINERHEMENGGLPFVCFLVDPFGGPTYAA